MANKRLLVSARDPGAAYHIVEIGLYFNNLSNEFDIKFVASEPAYGIFKRNNLPVVLVNALPVSNSYDEGASQLLDEAKKLINEFSPDAILVGLSGPDIGIDEALVACSGDCPTYAMQDFWGDVNHGFKVYPDTYFVLDAKAKEYTEIQVDSSVIVVGSPRHSKLKGCQEYAEYRLKNRIDSSYKILFVGQPLWELDGYKHTIKILASELSKCGFNGDVLYRKHPKESISDANTAIEIFKRKFLRARLDRIKLLENALCNADFIVSCYSSCGFDVAQLNQVSTKPLAGVLFLLFDEEIFKHYKQYTMLNDIPLTMLGLSLTVFDRSKLVECVNLSSSYSWRYAAWKSSKNSFHDSVGSVQRIHAILRRNI